MQKPVTSHDVPAEAAPTRRTLQKAAVAAAWVLAVGTYWIWANTSGVGPAETATRLVDFLADSAWGPLVMIGVYLVRPLFLFSAALLTVACGFLFGPVGGTLVVIVASNASAMVAYAVGRWFGGGRARRAGDASTRLGGYVERMRTRSFETTMILRLIFLPFDLVSYAAGAWRIQPIGFLAGTALGSIPGTLAFVLFGASIDRFDGGLPSLDATTILAAAGMLVVSLLLARIIRRRVEPA